MTFHEECDYRTLLHARSEALGYPKADTVFELLGQWGLLDSSGLPFIARGVSRDIDAVLTELDRRITAAEQQLARHPLRRAVRAFRAWLAYHIQPKR